MAVDSLHGEYQENTPLWEKVRDCVKGEDAVKAKGKTYLPKPSGKSEESYQQGYLVRAKFSNFTGRTAEGLHGGLFSEIVEQPVEDEIFKDFLQNVDNAGTSMRQFTRELTWDVLQTGWGGILVDYSRLPEGETVDVATANRLGLTAYLKWYKAENVINWRHDTVGSRTILSLVVLRETYEDIDEDEFVPAVKVRYRVLRLTDGVYSQQVYVKGEDGYIYEDPITPQMKGTHLNFIPFFSCPSDTPEKSMLLDLANENIGHYQSVADLRNALHISASPTGWGTSKPPTDKNGNVETVLFGGESFVWLGEENGRLGFLEPSGSGLSSMQRDIETSETRMRALGAKLFDLPRGAETAETARLRSASVNSILGAYAIAMSDIITKAGRIAAIWRDVSEETVAAWKFVLNTDYDGGTAKLEEKRLALEMIDDGVMSRVKFLIDYMGMEEVDAKAEVERIQKEQGYEPIEHGGAE